MLEITEQIPGNRISPKLSPRKEWKVTVARQIGVNVASTSKAAQVMTINTDSERSTQSQEEIEDKTSNKKRRCNMGPHDTSEMQRSASVSTLGTCDK